MKESSVVRSDPDILGGTPVFVGTLVPVQTLIDYIESGHSLDQFIDDFPAVTRELAVAALEEAKALLFSIVASPSTLERTAADNDGGACDSQGVIADEAVDFDLESEENRKSYEDGDTTALLRMLEHCALFRRAMPEWASFEFDSIYRAALAGGIQSWDDVFGRPWHPKRPRAQRRAVSTEAQKWAVWKRVRDLHEGEGKPPIDNALFERVGRETGVGGKSTVAALYVRVERAVRRVLGSKR
jgi:uncharacterized protein (DUF433 family)